MDLKIHVTVHAYAEEQLHDEVLVPHSGNYGILGKEIVAPLRRINGKSFSIRNVEADFSIINLWDWVDERIYEIGVRFKTDPVLTLAEEFSVIQKYLVFDGLRYSVDSTEKPITYFLRLMGCKIEDTIEIQLLVCMDAGTVFEDDGIRYYMNSKEAGKHNLPHVHVDIRHERSGSFSIITGEKLSGDRIRSSDEHKIRKMIAKRRAELFDFWNKHTDGLTVDLDQALGLIGY